MILGADVTHPAPGSFAPSIASIVGTFDNSFAKYASEIDVQLSRNETIEGTEKMVGSLLNQFFTVNKKYPSRVSNCSYLNPKLED